MEPAHSAAVDLYWIPLGAGGHCVRFNGKVYEALVAARERRPRRDLYHAAMVVELGGDRFTIELAPSPDARESSRGVVATGPVGARVRGAAAPVPLRAPLLARRNRSRTSARPSAGPAGSVRRRRWRGACST